MILIFLFVFSNTYVNKDMHHVFFLNWSLLSGNTEVGQDKNSIINKDAENIVMLMQNRWQ